MSSPDVLFELLDDLDASKTVVTSIRQPAALRDAVRVAVELGMATNPNELSVAALRDRVEAFAQHLALEAHVSAHPQLRPTLGDLALAAAELDGHALAGDADFLRACAEELERVKPDATGEDVVTFAMGRQSAAR